MDLRKSLEHALARVGINGRQLAVLLKVYLKQDLRGGKVASQFGKGSHLSSNRALISIAGIYIFLGLSVGVLAFTGLEAFTFSIFVSSYTLFIVAMALMAESGNVILNESEADVLGHLPISPRTQLVVKLANLFLFTLLLAASANLLPAIMGIFSRGSNAAFVLAHACSTVLVALFATTIVVLSYGMLMRHVSKERLDSFVAYSQVGLALVFMLSYQLIPRLVDIHHPQADVVLRWYHYVYPPAWFAGFAMLLIGKWNAGTIALSAIGILTLVGLGSFALKKMAFNYASYLPQQSSLPRKRESARAARAVGRNETPRGGLWPAVKARFLHDPVERAIFDLVAVYLKRNREIKVRIYPSLASFVFFPIFVLLAKQVDDPFNGHNESFFVLLTIEMIFIVALTVLEGLVFSEHYRASYIFHVTPISSLARIQSGFRKVVTLYILVPGFVLTFTLLSAIWRNPVHALLAIAPWAPLAPVVLLIPFVKREAVPLSRKYQKGQQSARNAALMIISMIVLSIFLGIEIAVISARRWYWPFLGAVLIVSPLAHFVGRKLIGESRQLAPQDPLGAE